MANPKCSAGNIRAMSNYCFLFGRWVVEGTCGTVVKSSRCGNVSSKVTQPYSSVIDDEVVVVSHHALLLVATIKQYIRL